MSFIFYAAYWIKQPEIFNCNIYKSYTNIAVKKFICNEASE